MYLFFGQVFAVMLQVAVMLWDRLGEQTLIKKKKIDPNQNETKKIDESYGTMEKMPITTQQNK